MATAMADKLLSTGEAAKAISIDTWQLARLFERGLVEEPPRFGRYRTIPVGLLPKLRAAAIAAGYLPREAPSA
jgi:hypothetical protein